MSSVFRRVSWIAISLLSTLAFASTPPLRVCVDGNNLPFSNKQGQGFENAIARVVAHDLDRDIQFVWLPQQEAAVARAMKTENCDMVMGLTSPSDLMVPSIPYYRSTYVFVSRKDRDIRISSFADRRLADYRIGVHIIGGADATVPPGDELVRRGLVRNIVGYSIYGDPVADNPASGLITAVERGEVDLAAAWGPMAGYFAKHSTVPLDVVPICRTAGDSSPMDFDISMGIRRGNTLLRERVNQIIVQRQSTIREVLRNYDVPLLEASAQNGCH